MEDPLEKYNRLLNEMFNFPNLRRTRFVLYDPNELVDTNSISNDELDYELIEDDKTARFVFELAGMEKEEINIEMIDDELHVQCDNQKKSADYKISLKQPLEKPKATYKNGILEIVFQKAQKKSTKVKIE